MAWRFSGSLNFTLFFFAHEKRICGIETTLDQSEQRLSLVEAKLATVQTENAWLKDKVDDLENRSRRLNLRVVGIPERMEGSSPVASMTHFFEDLFGKDFFPVPPHSRPCPPTWTTRHIRSKWQAKSTSLHRCIPQLSSNGSSHTDVNER